MKSYDEVAKDVLRRRDEHTASVKKRNRMAVRIGVPVVSLCLAAMVGIGLWQSGEADSTTKTVEDAVIPGIPDVIGPDETDSHKKMTEELVETKVVEAIDKPAEGTADEIWIEPQWGEKMLYSKYPEFELSGTSYTTAATWIDGVKLGDVIGTTTAYGYDVYEDKSYEMSVTVYPINGISIECAVAVSYEGFPGKYAVYTNHRYNPETLGDFTNALNLRENLTFGNAYHSYYDNGNYILMMYDSLDPSVIWDMLFSDGTLENVSDEVTDYDMSFYKEGMSVSVNVDVLGIENVSLGVTENGYLTTNILATRKLFYIGEDKVQAFIKYVKENCDGKEYETVLEMTSAVEEPEQIPATTAAEPYVPDVVVTSPSYIPKGAETAETVPETTAAEPYVPDVVVTSPPYIPEGVETATAIPEGEGVLVVQGVPDAEGVFVFD